MRACFSRMLRLPHRLQCSLNLVFTTKFLLRLPQWTKIDISDEVEPPLPAETIMMEILEDSIYQHDPMSEALVNSAVLQANETGALVRVRRGTEDFQKHGPYVRSRRVLSLGFDPVLSMSELMQDRADLLDWVARRAPRRRHRTHSHPLNLPSNNTKGALVTEERPPSYGSVPQEDLPPGHQRFNTLA